MAKYNEQKIFEEIDKLTPDESYQLLQRVKDFIQKKLEAEQKEADERSSELQSKIQKISGS